LELVKDARVVELPQAAMDVYKQEEVAKFLATTSAQGVPNVALIVSQMPVEPSKLVFGEFMMVKTLANLKENSRVASIAISPKLEMGGFKGEVTSWTTTGEYIDIINSIPFFRYNAYAGIHNVAAVEVRKILELPPKVSIGHGAGIGGVVAPEPVREKFDGIMSIKVLAFADDDGYPNVVPAFGIMFRTPGEIRFMVSGYNKAVERIAPPAKVALNVLTLDLRTYQVKGTLVAFEKHAGLKTGVIKLEEVYSSMPPLIGERLA
jgi:predicted pyridoxine 5'-phosphate oxidase superfamily flavin-nucleotide-binding protein